MCLDLYKRHYTSYATHTNYNNDKIKFPFHLINTNNLKRCVFYLETNSLLEQNFNILGKMC